jgi:hypothetical protein
VTLSWNPSETDDIADIYVKLDISHHGTFSGQIECETADTGMLVLPASMITALKALGYAGFPSITVTRKAVGSALTPYGQVDLEVRSSVTRLVDIPGLESCNDVDLFCTDGQECQDDMTCP